MEAKFDKKLLSQIGLLTGMGVLLPAVGTAEAGLICGSTQCVQTETFSFTSEPSAVNDPFGSSTSNDPESTTITFDSFDSALGTLTQIDVSLRSTLFGDISVTASSETGETGHSAAETTWNPTITLTMPGINFADSPSDSVACDEQAFTCTNSKLPSISENKDYQFLLGSLPVAYLGPGTFNAFLTLDLALSVENQGDTVSGSAHGTGSATWDPPSVDGITITYTFTPAATVPEPATLALLGVGALAGLGFARRRSNQDG